jgi:type VI secretion system protein
LIEFAPPRQLRRSALLFSKENSVKQILLGCLVIISLGGQLAHGQSKLDVRVHITPAANQNNPVAVDLVLVSDNKLLKELMKMSAKEWFAQNHQIQLDYPKETDLFAGRWEWVPGQTVQLDRIPVRRSIVGGVIFAKYVTAGAHRAVINPRKDILLTLGEKDICVQLAKEMVKACP